MAVGLQGGVRISKPRAPAAWEAIAVATTEPTVGTAKDALRLIVEEAREATPGVPRASKEVATKEVETTTVETRDPIADVDMEPDVEPTVVAAIGATVGGTVGTATATETNPVASSGRRQNNLQSSAVRCGNFLQQ